MASKYKEVAKNLTAFQLDEGYQAELDQIKKKLGLRKMKVQDLAAKFAEYRDQKDEFEERLKSVNKILEAINQVMVAKYEENDTESMKFDGLGTFFTKLSPYPQVKDRAALKTWLKDQGLEDMLTINYKSLEGMVNQMLLDGENPPDGVEVFIKTSIQRRK